MSCARYHRFIAMASLLLLSLTAGGAGAQEPGGDSFRAVIVARDRATLAAEIAGRIISLPYAVGASFQEGQPLAAVDCRLLDLNLAKATQEAQAALTKWRNITRLARLQAAGELTVKLAEIEKNRLEIERSSAQLIVSRCVIKAPFSGRVVRVMTQQYENVNVGQPVIEIVGSRNVEIESAIPANVALKLHNGDVFDFVADGAVEQPISGKIIALAPVVDPVSQLVMLRGVLEERENIIIGVTGSLRFRTSK